MPIGCTAPAPSPWTSRKTISAGMLHAKPHSSEPSDEQPDAEQHHRLAAVEVGDLAVDRDGHRLGEQVDREQPGERREAAEVVDHRRHRGGQDRRVDRDQADAEHDRQQQRPPLAAEADAGSGDLGSAHVSPTDAARVVFPRRRCPHPDGRAGRASRSRRGARRSIRHVRVEARSAAVILVSRRGCLFIACSFFWERGTSWSVRHSQVAGTHEEAVHVDSVTVPSDEAPLDPWGHELVVVAVGNAVPVPRPHLCCLCPSRRRDRLAVGVGLARDGECSYV